MTQLTVMTYNIRSALNHPDRLEALARVIEEVDPDILALQEVDRNTVRSDHTDQAAWLAERLGLPHYFFSAATPWEGGGEYGTALLSRFELGKIAVQQLYVESGHDVPASATEPRALACARIHVNGHELQLFNTHLGLTQKQRGRQAQEIAAAVAAVPTGVRVLLTGDLNAQPSDPELKPLLNLLEDTHRQLSAAERGTYPQGVPLSEATTIDYILYTPGLFHVHDAFVVEDSSGASDHNLVVTRLELPAE